MSVPSCDLCSHETTGYSKTVLLKHGWKWHDAGAGRMIVVCGECSARLEPKPLQHPQPSSRRTV